MISSIRRWARLLHKWAGLLLAIQIFFWIAGGLIMSAIPLEKVHGKHLANKHAPPTTSAFSYTYSIDKLVEGIAPQSIQLIEILSEPYYLINSDLGVQAYHANSGELLTHIDAQQAQDIAELHYLGSGSVVKAELLHDVPLEASRNDVPVWRVNFDDTWNTSLYIASATGQLTTIRSDIWRIFDFVWMLHIMDYDTRDDFNNPLLISFAAASLIFTLSGVVLLYFSMRSSVRKRR